MEAAVHVVHLRDKLGAQADVDVRHRELQRERVDVRVEKFLRALPEADNDGIPTDRL